MSIYLPIDDYECPPTHYFFDPTTKPLMHLLESSLFVDQIAACGAGDLCYVRNDYFDKVTLAATFEAFSLTETKPRRIHKYKAELQPGSIDWFELPLNFTLDIQVTLVRLKVYHDSFVSNPRISESVYLKDMPKNIKGLHNRVHVDITEIRASKNGDAEIVLVSDKLALFVVLTTRAEGIFSQNCINTLKVTLRVEHLGLYMNSPSILADS